MRRADEGGTKGRGREEREGKEEGSEGREERGKGKERGPKAGAWAPRVLIRP
jgi:hypothetical protein